MTADLSALQKRILSAIPIDNPTSLSFPPHTPQAVSRAVRRLELRGLVRRVFADHPPDASPRARRTVRIESTGVH